MNMPLRVAIIGAGLAGLTAANELVDAGSAVSLFERADEPGGRASTTTHEGYRFNQGPHALYRGGEANAVLRRLGIEPAGHPPVLGKARGLLRGELHTLPVGPASLIGTKLIGAREKVRFGTMLARLGRLSPEDFVGSTVREWAAMMTTDPAANELLLALVRLSTYDNAPDLACAAAAVQQLQMALAGGVIYLDGGWGHLVGQLVDRASARGATIERRTIAHVDAVLDDFDAVVIAVGSPVATDNLLGMTGSVDRAGSPVEAAVLELGVSTVPQRRFILGVDEPLYASVHAPPADLAPAGHSVVCVARYLAPGEQHDADRTRRRLTDLAYRLGITGSDVVTSRYLHRMAVTNGRPLAASRGMAGRPKVDLAGDPRIAVAGDWVGPAGLLADASVASGSEAADHLMGARAEGAAQ